ncbi:MAG TPA: DUF4382 domain-containing protein [Bacteroidota bacterium]|nr:DUF4382 domain-containing protein [Bacteroidota bacterium]
MSRARSGAYGFAGIACAILLSQLSCNKNPASTPIDNLVIKLIDSPATLDQEVIVMRRIEVHKSGSPAELDWRVINGQVATYDLLKFRNGVTQVIASTYVPPGSYGAIRITFEGSYVWTGGKYILLDLPSGVAGGFVIEYPLVVEANNTYELVFDFDASRSVHQTSPTTYTLNPVFRIQDASIAGSIAGAVVSADSLKPVDCLVESSVGTDPVATSPDLTTGSFQLGALPEGAYNITIVSPDSVFKDTTLSNIQVLRQRQTSIGVVGLLRR